MGQTIRTDIVMKDHNSILIEGENAVVEELGLIPKTNQDDERKLLKIAKEEEEDAETELQHAEDVK